MWKFQRKLKDSSFTKWRWILDTYISPNIENMCSRGGFRDHTLGCLVHLHMALGSNWIRGVSLIFFNHLPSKCVLPTNAVLPRSILTDLSAVRILFLANPIQPSPAPKS